MFLKRVMSGSARISKRLVLRRKMHFHQVWCNIIV